MATQELQTVETKSNSNSATTRSHEAQHRSVKTSPNESRMLFSSNSELADNKKSGSVRWKKKRASRQEKLALSLRLYKRIIVDDDASENDGVFLKNGSANVCSPYAASTPLPAWSFDTSLSPKASVCSHSVALDLFREFGLAESVRLKPRKKAKFFKHFEGDSPQSESRIPPHCRSVAAKRLSSSFSGHSTTSSSRVLPVHVGSVSVPCSLSRSLSARRRKRPHLFGSRRNGSFTTSSMSSAEPPSQGETDPKLPSPVRFTTMYHAVRKGISDHIALNTIEFDALEKRINEANTVNAARTYDSEKLIKHFERVIKKLQYQQSQLDEVHEAYSLQQRYKEGAYKLKSALNSSRVSSRSSMIEIKSDIDKCAETLYTLEQELTALFGRFHFIIKGLVGFARLRAGDQYEITLRYGSQKWRTKGTVKTSTEQTWDSPQRTMQPLLSDLLHVKVTEVKLLGKHSTVGSTSCETKDLFKLEEQDLLIDLGDTATIKLNLNVKWSPYDGYEAPPSSSGATGTIAASTTRLRAKSTPEHPSSSVVTARSRLSSAFTKPLSVIYPSSTNSNNSNNKQTLKISAPILAELDVSSGKRRNVTDESIAEKRTSGLQASKKEVVARQGEEDAFMAAISKNLQLAASVNDKEEIHEIVREKAIVKKNSMREQMVSEQLISAVTKINLQLDDYRGRYPELRKLENTILRLVEIIKVDGVDHVVTDGFSVIDTDDNDNSVRRQITSNFEEGDIPTTGRITCDEALIPHLNLVGYLLKDIGVFGPLKVRELLALDKLEKQGKIIARMLDIATREDELSFDGMPEFEKRRTLLEMWRSCCDGNTLLCISGKTLRLELVSAFGRDVRTRHSDVAEKVFPELVRRIIGRPDVADIEREAVTLFHLSSYVDDAVDGEVEDLEKLVNKLALEMFITSTLSSGIHSLVLVAIKRISSLLALRLSNLRALSHLLLDNDHTVRTATAAHIRHIATEKLLKEKAVVAYAELLESKSKKDRQCACIAIGFLAAVECIPQLAYLYHSDVEPEVREAASNVLLSFGEEGVAALDYAASTLLAQTMTQQVSLSNHARMGTAL